MFINLEHFHDCEQVNIKQWLNIAHLKETPMEQGREAW